MKCGNCDYENDGHQLTCNLCGHLLMAESDQEPGSDSGAPAGFAVVEGRVASPGDATSRGPRLIVAGLPPAPLKNPFVVGRDDKCDLVLRSNLISRSHAVFDELEGRHRIVDKDSANGTVVNGVPLDPGIPRVLSPGDNVTIGPYTIRFVIGEDEGGSDDSGAQTTHMQVATEYDAGFSGRLAELSLLELLQSAGLYRKTGTLRIRVGLDQGSIVIEGGAPYAASFAGSVGMDAVKRLVLLEDGEFRFESPGEDFPPGERELDITMSKLLLQAHRFRSEREG